MKLAFRAILNIALLALLATSQVLAEQVEDMNLTRSRFFIDHAVFADTNHNRLEIYYKIFNDALHYVKKGDKFVANYELSIIVMGDKEKQVTGRSVERTYALDDYALTHSEIGFLINQVSLYIPPGEFEITCKMIDHNSGDVSTIQAKINSPTFNAVGDLSEIEIVQDVESVDSSSPFYKGGLAAVPIVERSLDGESQRLVYFVELYTGGFVGKNINLSTEINAIRSEFETEKSVTLTIDSNAVATKQAVDMSELTPGDYDLIVRLKNGEKVVAERKTRFSLKWSLASLIKNDFDYAVEQLKYIIDKDEKKMLEEAPESLRIMTFEAFWKGRDPSPNTDENEVREEYYRRIRYANQYYSTINREGWLTDRGMIYIKNGEPDQIDRYPFELGRKPYQVWYYYTNRRAFYFIDERGDGDFQLQYPFDGDWRGRGLTSP